jgi:hypothetical protein
MIGLAFLEATISPSPAMHLLQLVLAPTRTQLPERRLASIL